MRSNLVEIFQSTLSEVFDQTIDSMLGSRVRDEIFRVLQANGVPRSDIALRFDETVAILTRIFGSSARVLVFKTVVSLYEEYSQQANFGFYDSLRDRVALLKEKVMVDLLKPRHSPGIDESIYLTSRSMID